jgi:hypothetical protein
MWTIQLPQVYLFELLTMSFLSGLLIATSWYAYYHQYSTHLLHTELGRVIRCIRTLVSSFFFKLKCIYSYVHMHHVHLLLFRLHVIFYQLTSNICYFPSCGVNNLNWGGWCVSLSSSCLCGSEECSFGLWCRFGTHGVLLLLDILSNHLGWQPLARCGEILCDSAQVSIRTLFPPFPLLEFPFCSL